MKKKLVIFLSGAAAVAGFALVTGFGGMTKAQQMTAIEEKVTANLATLRETKTKECDDRVATAANTKAQEMLAAEQEPMKQGIGPGKPVKKPTKGNTKGGKVDPLPQPTPPAKKPADSQTERGGTKTPENQESRKGVITPEKQQNRGGVKKPDGGGN